MTPFQTREEWLTAAVAALSPIFDTAGETLPPVRVSVGWPGGRGAKGSVIGQCWKSTASADSVPQMFISPVLGDAARVLDVLAHELIHALDDCTSGHRGRFAKVAKEIGLTGKMTATVAGPELASTLADIAASLGEYPHAVLTPGMSGVKTQGTRMVKVTCPEDGYTIRATRKWLDVGLPTCPCGAEMTEAA